MHTGSPGEIWISHSLRARSAVPGDAALLAPRLREDDVREIRAASGRKPLAALEEGIAVSAPCFALLGRDGDEPLALFGVCPDSRREEAGLVWLLAAEELVQHGYAFLRHSQEWLDKLHERYELLWNCVDARNELHHQWLEWCGFTRLRRIDSYGVEGLPFYQFVRRRQRD